MPTYGSSEKLYTMLKLLFERIKEQGPDATQAVSSSRLIIRIRYTAPTAEVTVDGRRQPVRIDYGASALRPDLDVEVTADAFHRILLAELPLKKALVSRQLKVRGPLFKTFALEEIFHQGQAIYPQLVHQQGMEGFTP